jgi:hypothetical protein
LCSYSEFSLSPLPSPSPCPLRLHVKQYAHHDPSIDAKDPTNLCPNRDPFTSPSGLPSIPQSIPSSPTTAQAGRTYNCISTCIYWIMVPRFGQSASHSVPSQPTIPAHKHQIEGEDEYWLSEGRIWYNLPLFTVTLWVGCTLESFGVLTTSLFHYHASEQRGRWLSCFASLHPQPRLPIRLNPNTLLSLANLASLWKLPFVELNRSLAVRHMQIHPIPTPTPPTPNTNVFRPMNNTQAQCTGSWAPLLPCPLVPTLPPRRVWLDAMLWSGAQLHEVVGKYFERLGTGNSNRRNGVD